MLDGDRQCRVCGEWLLLDDCCPRHETRHKGKIQTKEYVRGYIGGVTESRAGLAGIRANEPSVEELITKARIIKRTNIDAPADSNSVSYAQGLLDMASAVGCIESAPVSSAEIENHVLTSIQNLLKDLPNDPESLFNKIGRTIGTDLAHYIKSEDHDGPCLTEDGILEQK